MSVILITIANDNGEVIERRYTEVTQRTWTDTVKANVMGFLMWNIDTKISGLDPGKDRLLEKISKLEEGT